MNCPGLLTVCKRRDTQIPLYRDNANIPVGVDAHCIVW